MATYITGTINASGTITAGAGIHITGLDANGRSIDLTSLDVAAPYLDIDGNFRFPATAPSSSSWNVVDKNGMMVIRTYTDGTRIVQTANNILDSGGGGITVSGIINTHVASGTLGANYTTASTTAVSTGFGVSLSSPGTALEWIATAVGSNNTAGDGIQMALYRSSVGIPAAGVAPGSGDTTLWSSGTLLSSAANQEQVAAGSGIDTGLTAGTTYYYYLAALAVTGGTATVLGGANTMIRVRAID